MPSVLDPVITRLGPIGSPSRSSGRRPSPPRSTRDRILGIGGQEAIKAGLGVEGAKAVQAVLATEDAFTPGRVGDLEGGGSYGPLQFYAQGMLPAFAQSLGVTVEAAKAVAEQHPEVALAYAVRGYLGDAIRTGLAKGLTGSALATWAQSTGQRSEEPERAGATYTALFSADPTPIGLDRPDTTAYKGGTRGHPDPNLVPNQFGDATLTPSEAVSACGPAAAVAFARRWGRNPTLREAVDLAKTVGWTESGGMNGLANQERLVKRLAAEQGVDIPVKTEYGPPNWDKVVHDAMTGNPVTVSTNIHYYVIDGYDPQTGKFHVGQSGLARKDINSAWASAADITRADGTPNGVLFVDSPLSQTSSVAARPDDGSRDDWRTSSRPETNTGTSADSYGYEDDEDPDGWQVSSPTTMTGHERPLDPSAYPTGATPDPFNPYDTPGWRAAAAIQDDFTYGLPQRQQSFLQENAQPIDLSAFRAPQPSTEAPPSPFADLLDPSRGLPLSPITAPKSPWRFS